MERCGDGQVFSSTREVGFIQRELGQSKMSVLQKGVQLDRAKERGLGLSQLLAFEVNLPKVLLASAVRRSQGDRFSQLVDCLGRIVQAPVTKRQQRMDSGRPRVRAGQLLEQDNRSERIILLLENCRRLKKERFGALRHAGKRRSELVHHAFGDGELRLGRAAPCPVAQCGQRLSVSANLVERLGERQKRSGALTVELNRPPQWTERLFRAVERKQRQAEAVMQLGFRWAQGVGSLELRASLGCTTLRVLGAGGVNQGERVMGGSPVWRVRLKLGGQVPGAPGAHVGFGLEPGDLERVR